MAGIERASPHGGADAPATVAKRATDPAGRRALATEAAVLGRLAHPGVVRLVAHVETERGAQLLTEKVPGRTLAELAVASAPALAAIAATGAAVVGDLHELGIAHGSLAGDHLIVSAGRVVLCSFGRATDATVEAMDRDVSDLVVAITEAAGRLDDPATRVERRRRRRLEALLLGAASRSLSATDLAAALAELAADAPAGITHRPLDPCEVRTDDSDAPTSAVQPDEADAAADRSPLGLPRPEPWTPGVSARPWRERVARHERRPVHGEDRPPAHRRRNLLIGAAAGLVVVALWAAWGPNRRVTDQASAPRAAQTTPPTPTMTAPVADSPTPPATDDRRYVVIGNLVGVDDAWFEVGRKGDVVRVADWDCDGAASPAVLRPGSGEIFVFERWADEREVLDVAARAVHPDAADIVREPTTPCGALVVIDRSGRRSVVEPAR